MKGQKGFVEMFRMFYAAHGRYALSKSHVFRERNPEIIGALPRAAGTA
jgi:hypothetical protein